MLSFYSESCSQGKIDNVAIERHGGIKKIIVSLSWLGSRLLSPHVQMDTSSAVGEATTTAV
jgi:hypothetical protein